jgi:hypothetical protein
MYLLNVFTHFHIIFVYTNIDGELAVIIDRLNSFLEDIGKPTVQKVNGYINI